MEFLPIARDGSKVYAGFWRRLGALLVDNFVLVPFVVIFVWLDGLSISSAMVAAVASVTLFDGYTIYFHSRFGATPGKMVTNIKVTLPNGSPIGFSEAFLRSSVGLGFSMVATFARLSAIVNADAEQYLSLDWTGREEYASSLVPAWYGNVELLGELWLWSEVVVLLFNQHKRALHDFIAGTVVIHKRFAK